MKSSNYWNYTYPRSVAWLEAGICLQRSNDIFAEVLLLLLSVLLAFTVQVGGAPAASAISPPPPKAPFAPTFKFTKMTP